jgi:hypothetical protein
LIQTTEITKENNFQVQIDGNSRHALSQQLQAGDALSLSKGIYFITRTINDELITKKIIIK